MVCRFLMKMAVVVVVIGCGWLWWWGSAPSMVVRKGMVHSPGLMLSSEGDFMFAKRYRVVLDSCRGKSVSFCCLDRPIMFRFLSRVNISYASILTGTPFMRPIFPVDSLPTMRRSKTNSRITQAV